MLSIIIVNYKNEERTIRYVKEELVKISMPCKIIIVNNAASDESNIILVNQLEAELITNISNIASVEGKCYVISRSKNLGFPKGNNLGVEFSLHHFKVDYFLFSNNDIVFTENQTVERLLTKLEMLSNKIAVIGPAVIGLKGENQSPMIYLSIFSKWVLGLWYTPFLSHNRIVKFYKCDRNNLPEGVYYTLMGSFMLVRAKDFINCGMFDPNTFLYGEEAILAERLALIDKEMYYYPEVSIIHEHGQTINKFNKEIVKRKMMFQSDAYYYKRYKKTSVISIKFCWFMMWLHFYLSKIKRIFKWG